MTKKKTEVVATTKIQWRFDLPDADISTFKLDETKSWKGKYLRGHDVAEIIADEVWKTEAIVVNKIHIVAPGIYAGTYDVTPVFEPIFYAKKVECPLEKRE